MLTTQVRFWGNEGKRVSSGHNCKAVSEPELGGFTERVNGSITRDNETEWTSWAYFFSLTGLPSIYPLYPSGASWKRGAKSSAQA